MRMILVWLALIGISLGVDPTAKVMYPCIVHEVHDGDTIKVTIQFPWNISLGPEWVRAASYDAWEITRTRKTVTITEEELVKGKTARDAVAKLFSENKVYIVPVKPGGTRDVYGRILGDFYLVGKDGTIMDVAEWIKANGHQRQ